MRISNLASVCCLAVALGMAPLVRAAGWPAYRAQERVSGTVRIWGSPADARLIEELQAGFGEYQPEVRFQDTLHGPESTFAAVYMDVADIAFMAREIRVPLETMAFEWVHHYPPFMVQIANAGLGAEGEAARPEVGLAFFVNEANPLSCLTLRQLDDIFAAGHRRGGGNIRRWGELGIGGAWASRPIHVYGPPLDDVSAVFVRQSVLDGDRKWNSRYRIVKGGWGEALVELARDPDGISFAPPRPDHAGVKALRLAASSRSPCRAMTARTVEARTYPLTRTVEVALDRAPGTPIEPAVKEFLRFILSRQGQRLIASVGPYLPLGRATLRQQLQRLQ